jgi:hypothetical protein
VLGLGDVTISVATVNQTTFINGVVGEGRHSAEIVTNQFGVQLDCQPQPCVDISQTPAPCPPSRNKLELVSAPDIGCAELIAQAATWFPSALPDYPVSCP